MTGTIEGYSWLALIGGGSLALVGLLKLILSGARLVAWMEIVIFTAILGLKTSGILF